MDEICVLRRLRLLGVSSSYYDYQLDGRSPCPRGGSVASPARLLAAASSITIVPTDVA